MSALDGKEQVARFYEEFQSRGKYDYFYGDHRRKNLYVELIGKGKTILEVGCRAGNLTQFYHEGNQVVGVDVDRNALSEFEKRRSLGGICAKCLSPSQPFQISIGKTI
jgi:2-polyprenyl-3-methyl-5-hydroxy-6-metoxy-1,4-benzoquinol methylase